MDVQYLYDGSGIDFCDRETFSNTILLLSMVKSEYYYIVGFSRARGVIELAFEADFDGVFSLTEFISLSLYGDPGSIILTCGLSGLSAGMMLSEAEGLPARGGVTAENGQAVYTARIEKEKSAPVSIESMHEHIMAARSDICLYSKACFDACLSGGHPGV